MKIRRYVVIDAHSWGVRRCTYYADSPEMAIREYLAIMKLAGQDIGKISVQKI